MSAPEANRPPPARRRLAPEARRRQLTDAALAVFARNGLAGTVHADVAREAGVSVPTVFHYFPSRDALLGSVLEELGAHFMALARRHHGGGRRPARQALADHALAFMNHVDSHPSHVRLWLEWSTSVREDTWPSYLAFQERLVALIRDTIAGGMARGEIATGLSAEEAARLFVGCAHMAVMTRLAPPETVDVDAFVTRIIDTVIPGPAKRGHAS